MGFYDVLATICVLLFVVSLCNSQECKPRCSVPLTTCNFINNDVYIHAGTNITANEAQAKDIISQVKSRDDISSECKNYISLFVCSISYTSCNTSRGAQQELPCRQMCLDYEEKCGGQNIALPPSLSPYLNCSSDVLYTTPSPSSFCHSLTSTSAQCSVLPPVKCSLWNATRAPKTGAFCGPFVSGEVYTPAPISYLDNEAYDKAFQFIKPYFPVIPLGCYKYLVSYICSQFFPTCHRIYVPEYSQTIALGSKVCKSVCDRRVALCDDMFQKLNITLAGCDAVPPGPEIPTKVSTTDNGHIVTVNNTCQDNVFPPNPSVAYSLPPFDRCPVVLGRAENPSEEKNDPRCWLKCPDASYTDDEWQTLVTLTQIGASLSFVSMAFLLVSYLVHHDRRRFPMSIHIWEFVSCMILSISFFLNGRTPEKDVWCNDPATFATQSNNPTCGAQGFLFIMFGLAVATWCCVIAFVMFRAIVFNIKVKEMANMVKYFHLFGWGVPFAFALGALASNSIGYGVPLAWCFIQFEGFGFGDPNGGISVDYYVFYIPIGVLFVLITTMFWQTVVKIYQVRQLQIAKNGNKTKGSRTFQAQVRVLIFIFSVYIVCFTIFEWRFQIEAENHKHGFDEVGFDWIVCKIKTEVNKVNDTRFQYGNCPGDVPPARINYPHTAAESFFISAVGFFMFFGFGSDLGIYRHWRKIFTLLFKGDFEALTGLVVFGRDPFGGSTKSKSDSGSGTSERSKKGTGTGTGSGSINTDSDLHSEITSEGGIPLSTKAQVYLA